MTMAGTNPWFDGRGSLAGSAHLRQETDTGVMIIYKSKRGAHQTVGGASLTQPFVLWHFLIPAAEAEANTP